MKEIADKLGKKSNIVEIKKPAALIEIEKKEKIGFHMPHIPLIGKKSTEQHRKNITITMR